MGAVRANGLDGAPGKDGAPGTDGAQGPAGPQGPAAPDPSATTDVLSVHGQIQGDFVGPSGPSIPLTAISHEVISPRDPASGLPTRQAAAQAARDHELFLNALVSNENLTTVLIGLLRPGSATPYMTIKLTNAGIASRAQQGGSEMIACVYQKIEWTWVDGGIAAQDDWETVS